MKLGLPLRKKKKKKNKAKKPKKKPTPPKAFGQGWCPKGKNPYLIRNANLKDIGYASYKDYLKSQKWWRIRCRVLQDTPNCRLCGEPATEVHHTSYSKKVLRGENDNELHAVCRSCHEKIEINEGGFKRTFDEALNVFHALLAV